MPLGDLVGDGVTVRQFYRALLKFGPEIGMLRKLARALDGQVNLDIAVAMFAHSPEDGRLQYVLGTDDPEAVRDVARQIIPLAKAIDAFLGEPGREPDNESDGGDVVDAGVLFVFGCAERFHIDPMAVMNWPLGTFLDCVFAYMKKGHGAVGDAGDDQGRGETLTGGIYSPGEPAPINGPPLPAGE